MPITVNGQRPDMSVANLNEITAPEPLALPMDSPSIASPWRKKKKKKGKKREATTTTASGESSRFAQPECNLSLRPLCILTFSRMRRPQSAADEAPRILNEWILNGAPSGEFWKGQPTVHFCVLVCWMRDLLSLFQMYWTNTCEAAVAAHLHVGSRTSQVLCMCVCACVLLFGKYECTQYMMKPRYECTRCKTNTPAPPPHC